MTTETFLRTFGDDLRRKRMALDLSRGDLALHLGVSESSIANWECGKASMSVVTERRIDAYFRTVRAARDEKAKQRAARMKERAMA